MRGLRKKCEEIINFEDVPLTLSPEEEQFKDKYLENKDAQQLLRSLICLGKDHEEVNIADIEDDLKHEGRHGYKIFRKNLRPLLAKLVDQSLIKKEGKNTWIVPNIFRLYLFANNDIVEFPSIDELQSDDGADVITSAAISIGNNFISCEVEESGAFNSDEKSLSSISKSSTFTDTPESLIGKRVAKEFGVGLHYGLHYGRIVNFSHSEQYWKVEYDDGDDEQYDKDEMVEYRALYDRFSSFDPKRNSKALKRKSSSFAETSLEDSIPELDDIPLGDSDNTEQRKTYIVQPRKKRIVYYTGNDDTPLSVANRFKIDVNKLISDNMGRSEYKGMKKRQKFQFNSPILVALSL